MESNYKKGFFSASDYIDEYYVKKGKVINNYDEELSFVNTYTGKYIVDNKKSL